MYRIVLQGGDNMLGRAVNLTLRYRSEGDELIKNADSQRAIDYLDDIISNEEELNKVRNENICSDTSSRVSSMRSSLSNCYIWGDILDYNFNEDLRIINLECAPTYGINKSIKNKLTYHCHLDNIKIAFDFIEGYYVLNLNNNHALDMGVDAFVNETLTLDNILTTEPYIINNIIVYGFATGCSGVPKGWSGYINYLPSIDNDENVNEAMTIIKNKINKKNKVSTPNNDNIYAPLHFAKDKLIIVTIHWGPNYKYEGDGQEYRAKLAHRMIDELGVSLIHGHSSHHIRGLELYKGKLIIYGAGDLINDYENIPSEYNKNGALFVADLDGRGNLVRLDVIPTKVEKLSVKVLKNNDDKDRFINYINKMSRNDSYNPLIIDYI